MKYIVKLNIVWLLLLAVIGSSCDDEWLDVKRNRQTIIPQTLEELSLLLADEQTMTGDYISLLQISCDEYYLNTERFNTLTPIEKNAYLWKSDIYEQSPAITDWDNSYNQVLTSNVILEQLSEISVDEFNQIKWNRIKGGALYVRAKAFYNLSQIFAKPYDAATAEMDPGIPIRTTADLNHPVVRASVQQTYDRILADLKESVVLLPGLPAVKTDASKAGAFGLMARCYLSMREYELAKVSADSSLHYNDQLIDYNTIDPEAIFPFSRFNSETVQFGHIFPLYSVYIFVNQNLLPPGLYNLYDDNDLRKKLFFYKLGDGMYSFKGSYEGSFAPFSGIATDEMYLIRAECLARTNNVSGALDDLNTLLETRYEIGTFVPINAESADEVLEFILAERRKELIGRGLRWTDLRRLNQEPNHSTTLKRTIDGLDYQLTPNDARYVFAIPDYVIKASGIAQNSR